MAAVRKVDPRFEQETYSRNIFATREELTRMAKILLSAKSSWKDIIWTMFRLIALNILFGIRKNMFEEEMALGRQIYKQSRFKEADDDLKDPFA